MPFIDNPAPAPTGVSKWLNIAVTALSSSLYDDSISDENNGVSFLQEDVIEKLTDTIPPYAGADASSFTLEKSLVNSAGAENGKLVFEVQSGNDLQRDGDGGGSSSWSAVAEASGFGLVIDSEGGTEGSVSYTTDPLHYFTNGTSRFSAGATTGKEVALSLKCGPISAKTTAEVDFIGLLGLNSFRSSASAASQPLSSLPPLFDVHSCVASVKFALPEDIFCGHVLSPKFLQNCQRNFYLGCSWKGMSGSDVLRGSFAYTAIGHRGSGGGILGSLFPSSSILEGEDNSGPSSSSSLLSSLFSSRLALRASHVLSSLRFGVWGTFLLYKGGGVHNDGDSVHSGRSGGGAGSSSSDTSGADEDDCVAVGGVKIVHPETGTEMCVGIEKCGNGDFDTTFGIRRRFTHWWFPYTLSFGKTTDGDIGASLGVSIVDLKLVLGAHRRIDAEGGLWGGLPTFGLHVEF